MAFETFQQAIESLLDKLALPEVVQFGRETAMLPELKVWEKALCEIESVLDDATEKQLTERMVKKWLGNLPNLTYDMEDFLDYFATAALRKKLMKEEHDDTTIPLSPTVLNTKDIITSRLTDLREQTSDLGLKRLVGGAATAMPQRPPSTSLPTETEIYGRDEDRSKIINMLLKDDVANFGVVSIVGVGGIGKTTIAQFVYNDAVMENLFDLKAWVSVSYDFDVLRIYKVILETITQSTGVMNDLNQVQIQLKKAITGKRLLLVLDDVWSTNYVLWESFKSPFLDGRVRIVVTTRLMDVALTVRHSKYHELKLLSDNDSWSLFVNHALEGRDLDVNGLDLELAQKKVVKKCGGLPIAVRTLGGLMRSKQMNDEWEDVLSSKVWDLPEENGILPVLKLSYHNLPSHLKRCFAYCAILPKGYEFEETELVLYWMAEGLIQQTRVNKQLEELGAEYFRDLLSRSIFLRSSNDASKFKMHDLISDLAQWVAGDIFLRLEEEPEKKMQTKGIQNIRYCSYTCGYFDGKNKLEVLRKVPNLRVFLPLQTGSNISSTRYITHMFLSQLLPQLIKLRVLSLEKYYITELPDYIGDFKSLRYVNFSHTRIRTLPESVSLLFNLQTLNLKNCFLLQKLPSNMEYLIYLRHFDLTGVNLIKEMPLGIKKWENIRTLSNFIVGKGVGSGIEDLKNLNFLSGKLWISRLENVTYPLNEAVLIDKKGLKVLILEWGLRFDDSRNEAVEKAVLNVLQPHRNLKELVIKGYGGNRFPSWIGGPSFSNTVSLRLQNCKNCTSLPSLGQLCFLKDLTIEGMTRLKSIGSEIYGEGCSKPFQSLEILSFSDLVEWEHWDSIEENDQDEKFPRLRKLSIVRCPNLTGKLPNLLPSLKELVICQCAQLVVTFSSLPMLCKFDIDGCRSMVSGSITNFKSLEVLNLSNLSEFSDLFQQRFQNEECLKTVGSQENYESLLGKPLQGLHSISSLRELCIKNFPNLELLPDAHFLPVLSLLKIENCSALISLPVGLKHKKACLESLQIKGCHSLTSIVKGQLSSSLKRLEIKNCKNLQYLVDDRESLYASGFSSSSLMHKESINNTSTSPLEYLCISHCPYLTSLSYRSWSFAELKHLEILACTKLMYLSLGGQLPETLHWLSIVDCPELESLAERFYSNMSLRYIKIWGCENLKSLPDGLHHLSNLDAIYIWDCPSLVFFPERGLPDTNLRVFSIERCRILRALPNHLHSLNSLETLELRNCPSIVCFQEKCLPTNLTSLAIADLNINMPLIQCQLHNLISLTNLDIRGCRYVVSFPPEERGMMLPTRLTRLTIARFPRLKYLSSKGFQNLTSLEYLSINDCPKLASLPESGLPSSLLQLVIYNCPLLKNRCKRDKGEEWFKIAHIPCFRVDGTFIYDTKLEEELNLIEKTKKRGYNLRLPHQILNSITDKERSSFARKEGKQPQDEERETAAIGE